MKYNLQIIRNGIEKIKRFGIQMLMVTHSLNYNILMKIMHVYLLEEDTKS